MEACKYAASDRKVITTEDEALTCPCHEEADTKMIFHACQVDFDANVTILCPDTDILNIMLASVSNISENEKISY